MDNPLPPTVPVRRKDRRRFLAYLIAGICLLIMVIFLYVTLPSYALIENRAQWFGLIGIIGSCGFMAVTLEREWRKTSIAGIGLFGVSGVIFILSVFLG